ncbi:P-type conjugative transfer protein TrbG [Oricola sp.]|uniref:P-type conjugative transfer protein TrbG n=1 Tax=Oricola sp. TaxID=1979950 RepID=UPI0025CEBEC4|nr:P-type conjugative transfer protein TrbG [Oricola sp.]MCI5075313.1 P-type conjugative transfer protein TrbG [Oricola sp.]
MRRLIVLCACMTLGACAHKQLPPEIEFDTASFEPAALTVDPPGPVTIVEKAKPLPLPGQLKKAPGAAGKAVMDDRPPEERIASANKAAKVEPTKDGYVNAIQIYPFVEGALYQLYTAPEQVSDIVLQAGERIVAVSAGDTVRWVIGDTVSGSGDAAQAHVLVKPIKESLKTNLVIITDRRTYYLELTSDTETYMASVSWHYPRDELLALQRRNETAKAEQIVDRGLRLDQLKFRYAISGDNPPWRPVRVFDDTHKVYIQFPGRLDQGEAPPLFVVGPNGENQLVNYRVNGSYYIVDRLFAAAELRLGSRPQQIVRIIRTDGRTSGRRTLMDIIASNRGGNR